MYMTFSQVIKMVGLRQLLRCDFSFSVDNEFFSLDASQ